MTGGKMQIMMGKTARMREGEMTGRNDRDKENLREQLSRAGWLSSFLFFSLC
jgi:hypothetical protein